MSENKNMYDGSSDNFDSSYENGEDIDEIFSASTSKINTKRSEKGQPASSKSRKSNFDIFTNKRRGSEDTDAAAVNFPNATIEKPKISSNPIIIRRQIKRPKKGDGKSIKRPLLVNGLNENSTPSIAPQNADNENSLIENHFKDQNLTSKKLIPSSCKESSTNFYNGMKLENNNQGQYLGIQPAIKFRCFKCSENNFLTIAGLQKHMSTCSGVISRTAIRNRRNQDPIPESRTTMCITRRVYLCSSCRTYYQTWDLFVHMREVHKRQICLYCLNMFMNSMELKNHLIAVHKQSIVYYPTAKKLKQDFKDSFFVSCSDCNRLFTEGDNFTNHKCDVSGNAQTAVCSSRPIIVTPKKSITAAGTLSASSIKKAQSNESSVDEDDYDISHAASFCHVDLGGGGADETIGGSSLSIVGAKKSLIDSTNFPSSTKSSKKLSKLKRDEIDDECVIKKKKISTNDNNMPSLKFVIQRKSKDHVYLKNKSDSSPSSILNNDKTTKSFSDDGGEELNEKSIPTYDKLLTTSTPRKNIDEIMTNGDIDEDDDDSEGGERRLVIDEDYQQKNDDGGGKISDLSEEEKNIDSTNDGIQAMALTLDDKLDVLSLQTIIKECIRTACSVCLYCNNATNIAINGKQIAIHLLENHKFTPTKNNTWTDVIRKLKSGFDELESIFFNTDSFDSSDPTCHVPFNQIFACFQCHYVGTLQKELHLHKRKAHMKNIFSCIMCKCNFASYSELFCHLCPGNVANRPACYEFRCCFCGLNRIPSAFRLMVHLRKAHHTCDICMEKTDDQQKLYQHLMKHKIHHLCYKCGIAYRSKVDINRHLFWKHGAEGVICRKCLQKKWPYIYHFCLPLPVYTCDECNINFSKPIALTVHKRLHSNEYPFGCDKCEEKFIAKKLLEKHTEKIHTVRSSPVEAEVLEEQMKKIEGEKLSEDVNPDEKTDEKENKKKKKKGKRKPLVDVYDLPPLNLSSDSDDDDDDDDDSNPNKEESNQKDSNENEEDNVDKNEEIKSSIEAEKSEFSDPDPNKKESNQKVSNNNEENNVDKTEECKSSIEAEKSEFADPDPKKEEPNEKDSSSKNEGADKNKVESFIEAEKSEADSELNKKESNQKDSDLENEDADINDVKSVDFEKSEIVVPDTKKGSENKIIAAEGDKVKDRSSDTHLFEKKGELCTEESKLTRTDLEDDKEKSDPDSEKAEDQNGSLIVKKDEIPEENKEVEKESLGTANDDKPKEVPLEKVVDTPETDLAKIDNDIWKRLNILVDSVAEKEKTPEKESIPEPIVPNFDYIISEHNYCIPDSIFKTTEKNISASDGRYGDKKFNHRSRHNSECGTPCKQQKHHMKKDGRRGSSSSSSDSDTSASTCGSNCSCSHSSSSSSSSSDSDEDSSPEKVVGEKKKKKKCKQQKSTGESQLDESKSSSTPDENSTIINYSKTIQESDLETEISSAEEDFYSERPYEPPVIGDIPQTSIAEQEQSINKKSKSQKKKKRKYKDYLSKSSKKKKKTSQKSSPNSFNNNNRRPPSTSSYHQRVPPPSVVYGHPAAQNELLLPDESHDLESDGSRMKRKRTKNKFYGYSSSDEERTAGGPGGGLQGSMNKKINIKPDMPPRGSPNYINNIFPSPVDRQPIRPSMGPRVMYPSTSRMIGPGGYSGQQHLQRPEFGGYPPNLSGYPPNQQRLQRPSSSVYHRLSNPGLAFNRSPSRAPHGSVHQPQRLAYRLPIAQQHQQRMSSPMGGGTGLRILPPVNKKSNAAAAGGFSSSFSSSDSATNSPVKKVNPLYININTGVSSKPSVIHNNSLASTGMASGSSFYSNTSSIDPSSEMEASKSEKNDNLYCYCQCPYDEVSEMIACDGPNCKIEWFHFECVGIMVPPKGKWFCPSCRKGKEYAKYFP